MWSFGIDRGGTFTDVVATCSDGRQRVVKLLSVDPHSYPDAPTEGIRRVLSLELEATGLSPIPRGVPLPTATISSIRMGTTVATNALLERAGERTVLCVTKGFGGLLDIGTQSRPAIFDLSCKTQKPLPEGVIEVDERVILAKGDGERLPNNASDTVKETSSGENVIIERTPNLVSLREALNHAYTITGARSCAIALLHSYAYGAHEDIVANMAREIGFTFVSCSHKVLPAIRLLPRAHTACADAYLSPVVMSYISTFAQGFIGQLGFGGSSSSSSSSSFPELLFMQSDGGLCDARSFAGHCAVLSGPAGGVVGYSKAARAALASHGLNPPPLLAFDMGGTSTDVSRCAAGGEPDLVLESTVAGITLAAPTLDISTVAAGGGSRLFFRAGLLAVGPESAGAHPGPVAYRKNGFPTVTDANIVLGRVCPHAFPHIFGANEDEPLDAQASRNALTILAETVSAATPTMKLTVDAVAAGFVAVAVEAMCRPLRALSQMRGHDVSTHTLVCFGGAGPQHACAVAHALGIQRIVIPKLAAVLSAYGLQMADAVAEARAPATEILRKAAAAAATDVATDVAPILALSLQTVSALAVTRLPIDARRQARKVNVRLYVHARYSGTDSGIWTLVGEGDPSYLAAIATLPTIVKGVNDSAQVFADAYRAQFGFSLNRDILVDDVRARAVAHGGGGGDVNDYGDVASISLPQVSWPKTRVEPFSVYFEKLGRIETRVFYLDGLLPGARIEGPALILHATTSVVIEPQWIASIVMTGDIIIEAVKVEVQSEPSQIRLLPPTADPVRLSVYAHRFMGIAEQMGRTLQRTAVSVNIRERLDFSCALFSPDGSLVANAPHIPVHLGAMTHAVRFQIKYWKGKLEEGDVLVSNHPQLSGGSHLPDITVTTPIFSNGTLAFWVASRGHHADVGGIAPGSMPPHSVTLSDEGAAIVALKLVSKGVFADAAIREALRESRALEDCISDLHAQVAANTRGAALVTELVTEASVAGRGGLIDVHAYMTFVARAAEEAVREMFVAASHRLLPAETTACGTVHAADFMDDGTCIRLALTLNRATRTAIFDFTGTDYEVRGNTNCPPAVTHSAIIYVLRCLVASDVPLNEGCLTPINIIIPKGTILNPSKTAAVVGGNVLTSQRVVDVILKAFQACAASQGCMNNVTFGDATFGYYETVAGGTGAGPGWHGRTCHSHMT